MMKNRNMKKTTVKGMTLIECIIALLVFGITALMMATVCTTVSRLLLNSNHMNNKRIAEAPVVALQDKGALEKNDGSPEDIVGADGVTYTADSKQTVSFRIVSGSVDTSVDMDKYNTSVLAKASDRNTDTNMNGDLHFYIVTPTEAPGP